MGTEWTAEQYTGKGYIRKGGYEKQIKLYKRIVELLPTPKTCDSILDLGCGVGYFAKYLYTVGYDNYTGIDFSEHMIDYANKLKLVDKNYKFICGDLRDKDIHKTFKEYKIFTCIEALEHIIDDKIILENIPSGSYIVISVPSSDFKSHVRHFPTVDSVTKRYGKYIDFKQFNVFSLNPNKPNKVIYVFGGNKK